MCFQLIPGWLIVFVQEYEAKSGAKVVEIVRRGNTIHARTAAEIKEVSISIGFDKIKIGA